MQRGQTKSAMGMGKTALILILEGMISQVIFQRKSFSLSVRFNFHKDFHIVGGKRVKAEEDLGLEMSLYAVLVEKRPFVDGVQREGSEVEEDILIFWIALTLLA